MGDEGILRDVGPQEVDQAGELVKRVGVHNQAKRLIKQVTDNFPPELVAIGSRKLLGGRTQTLDLAEVADAAQDAFSDFTELLGAGVRGSEERPQKIAVNIVFRTASGRSARGAIAYAPLKKSKKNYDEGVKAGTIVFHDTDPDASKAALAEAQKTIAALRTQIDDEGGDPDAVEPGEAPEPYEGYEEAKAGERVEKIESGDLTLSELLAVKVAQDAESKPQKTVVAAVDEKIAAAEAALKPSDDD